MLTVAFLILGIPDPGAGREPVQERDRISPGDAQFQCRRVAYRFEPVHAVFRKSYSETVIVPPVSIFWETAIADFGKAGSIGAGTQIDYYRYKYHFLWDDGYGDKDIEVNSGQMLFMGVLSYHYTLATRLEIYAKAMAMISVVGRTYSEERLDPKGLDASFTFGAAVGLRYFFSRTWAVYAEGGRIPGPVAVGLTARW